MHLALLILIGILLRIVPIWGNNFPFAYDNAKDSLSIMDMWVTKSPTLLGPVSSLEGLYQGPFWYYLALPLNVVMQFHPLANVLMVLGFTSLAIILMYKLWGKLAALLFVISSGIIATQQTAWTPYITMFPAMIALIPLKKVVEKKQLGTLDYALFVLSVGLMLHTEIAFAVVFAIILGVILVRQKLFPSWKQILISSLVLIACIVPHAAFEIKHEFMQTKSVIRFVTHFREESAKVSDAGNPIQKFVLVTTSISNSFTQAIVPGIFSLPDTLSIIITAVFLILVCRLKKQTAFLRIVLFPMITTAFLVYLILPSKPFYFVSLMPFWIISASILINQMKSNPRSLLVLALVIGALGSLVSNIGNYKSLTQTNFILLSSRMKAVDEAYSLANGQAFASYQYVPEVYDFTYQQIYQFTALNKDRDLPSEISYQPGVSAYNPWLKRTSSSTDIQVLIVEKDERPQFFPVWWESMTKDREILETKKINDLITVYLTRPKK